MIDRSMDFDSRGVRARFTASRSTFVIAAMLLALSAPQPAIADILARYNFDDSNTNTDDADVTTSASSLAVGAGFTTTFSAVGNPAPSIVETYAQIDATDRDGAVAANDYFAFTVTPDLGIAMTLSSLTFDAQTGTDSSQAATFWVRSSVDGFIADFTQQSSTFTNHTVSLGTSQYANLTSPIEFRVFVSDQGSTDAGAAVRLDNITLNGTGANAGIGTGDIFGLKSSAAPPPTPTNNGSAAPTVLFQFNAATTELFNLGVLKDGGVPIDVDALAHSPTHGLLAYRVVSGNSQLVSVNSATGAVTSIGAPILAAEIRGAVVDASDRLLVLDVTNDDLLEIDPTSGAILSTVGLDLDVVIQSDLAVDANGNLLLTNSSSLYQINPTTGISTFLKTDTNTRLSGAATTPTLANQLLTYDINGDEDIRKFGAPPGYTPALVLGNILPQFEAGGGGDLASITVVVPEPSPLNVLGPLAALGYAATCAVRRWKVRRVITR